MNLGAAFQLRRDFAATRPAKSRGWIIRGVPSFAMASEDYRKPLLVGRWLLEEHILTLI